MRPRRTMILLMALRALTQLCTQWQKYQWRKHERPKQAPHTSIYLHQEKSSRITMKLFMGIVSFLWIRGVFFLFLLLPYLSLFSHNDYIVFTRHLKILNQKKKKINIVNLSIPSTLHVHRNIHHAPKGSDTIQPLFTSPLSYQRGAALSFSLVWPPFTPKWLTSSSGAILVCVTWREASGSFRTPEQLSGTLLPKKCKTHRNPRHPSAVRVAPAPVTLGTVGCWPAALSGRKPQEVCCAAREAKGNSNQDHRWNPHLGGPSSQEGTAVSLEFHEGQSGPAHSTRVIASERKGHLRAFTKLATIRLF